MIFFRASCNPRPASIMESALAIRYLAAGSFLPATNRGYAKVISAKAWQSHISTC